MNENHPPRILVLNGACAHLSGTSLVAAVSGTRRQLTLERQIVLDGAGSAENLPIGCHTLMYEAGWSFASLCMIAVVIGPGSFTGLRASIALAQGLAIGESIPLVGVTLGEALAPAMEEEAPDRTALCLTTARRNRIFMETCKTGQIMALSLDNPITLPEPDGRFLIAGDAAAGLARTYHEQYDLQLSRHLLPDSTMIAAAALDRHEGLLPPRRVMPLYVDPPEAKPPRDGLRPPPV